MVGRIVGAVIVGILALVAWLGIATALDVLHIWERQGMDGAEVRFVGAWIVGLTGFAAPLLLTFIFHRIYGPVEEPPAQKKRAPVLRKPAPEKKA